jgi:hypothetical protein
LLKDAGKDRDDLKGVHAIRDWGSHLREIATEDGIPHLKQQPSRAELFNYGRTSNHPTFSMLSELGSHAGAAGSSLFMHTPGSGNVNYDLMGALVMRSFFLSSAIVYLWETYEAVSNAIGWTEWLDSDARPSHEEAAPLMAEALRRRQEQHGV